MPSSPNLSSQQSANQQQLSAREILSNTALRGPVFLCVGVVAFQALSGVNAVIFYSTPILRPIMPTSAGLIGIAVAVVNVVMTLPAVLLVDVRNFVPPGLFSFPSEIVLDVGGGEEG